MASESNPPDLLLPLESMADRHGGLTPSIATAYIEAARVCLDRHHTSPTTFKVGELGREKPTRVEWQEPDEQCRSAYANEIDTTEWGAYACALASTELLLGLYAIRRAETRTGADYYLAPKGKTMDDLEECVRLEVSGIDNGTHSEACYRLSQKLKQAKAGASNLPALAAVVAFGAKQVLLQNVA